MFTKSESLEKTSTCLMSHPNRCLKEHLEGVKGLVESVFPLGKEEVKKLALLTAKFHDCGKATSYFQEYMRLLSKGEEKRAKRIPLQKRQHSLLSAVILYYYLTKKQRNDLSKRIHPLLETRGVPGTHATEKITKTIQLFDKKKRRTEISQARFLYN